MVVGQLQRVGAGVRLREHLQHCQVLLPREGAKGQLYVQALDARLGRHLHARQEKQEEALLLESEPVQHRPEGVHEEGALGHLLLHGNLEDVPDVDALLVRVRGADHLPQLARGHPAQQVLGGQRPEAVPHLLHRLGREYGPHLLRHVLLAAHFRRQRLDLLQRGELSLLHLQALLERGMENIVKALEVGQGRLRTPAEQHAEEEDRQRKRDLATVDHSERQQLPEAVEAGPELLALRAVELVGVSAKPVLAGAAVELEERQDGPL
mmetsp:Transcript_9662/g.27054  ORF Transcript_9662/g.27054 Transcript_9662/m.27054 type:complete len:266 (+) Transcript_9662:591-1388(+)